MKEASRPTTAATPNISRPRLIAVAMRLWFLANDNRHRNLVFHFFWIEVDAKIQAVDGELARQAQTCVSDFDFRGNTQFLRHTVQGQLTSDLTDSSSGLDLDRFEFRRRKLADRKKVGTLQMRRQHVEI